MTVVGKALLSRLKNDHRVAYALDRKMDGMSYLGVPIYGNNHFKDLNKDVVVVIALTFSEDVIGKMLKRAGYGERILKIRDFMESDT